MAGLRVMLIVFLGLVWTAFSASGETLTWVKFDAPPYFILSGPHKGQGIADGIVNLLQKRLPDYEHKVLENVPISRVTEYQKAGEKVIMVAALPTPERRQYLLFTEPALLNPPYSILALRDSQRLGSFAETLSLETLLASGKYQLAVSDRVYGPLVDGILAKFQDKKVVFRRMGSSVLESLVDMLEAGRVDFILGTPYEAQWLAQPDKKRQELQVFAIQELENSWLPSNIALPKTAWGEQMRQTLDKILKEVRQTPEYRALFTRWLDPATAKKILVRWRQTAF